MSIYAFLSLHSETQFFRSFVDDALTYLSTNFPNSGLADDVFAAYHLSSGTAFAPSQFAILSFAQAAGYIGVDSSGAHQAIFAVVQQDSVPGSGQALADFMTGFLVPGAKPLAMVDGQVFLNINATPGLTVNGTMVSDGDAETPDAVVLSQNVGVNEAYYLTSQVTSTLPLSFNAPPPLQGSSGDDHLNGTDGDESIQLNDGNDFFNGKRGNDTIEGQDGEDRLRGGGGHDEVSGGSGEDRIWGDNGDDILKGNAGNDILDGGKHDDLLYGGSGDDLLKGSEGDDVVRGGNGNDQLHGNKGDDRLVGGSGDDRLIDAQGDSTLIGGAGDDFLKGGVGSDTFVFRLGGGTDFVKDFVSGVDTLHMANFGLSGIADLTLSQQGDATRIDLGTGEVIVLDDTLSATLSASDFIF
ncbi:MAG: calcium-binding protein [Sedimentitalea sp.]